MDDDEHAPEMTDDAAAEVMGLVRLALGERISDTCDIEGDVNEVMQTVLEHTINDDYSVWVAGTTVNVSFCPACASISMCAIAPMPAFIHACIELMEHLRDCDGLGGDPDMMTCTYRRVPVRVSDTLEKRYAYAFAGNYWLDLDGIDDKVFHTTRALVTVVDEVSGLLDAIDRYRRDMN